MGHHQQDKTKARTGGKQDGEPRRRTPDAARTATNPHTERLSALQSRANDSPQITALSAMGGDRARRAMPQAHVTTTVTGLTHPVAMKGRTIYGGTEAGEYQHGQALVVDPGDRILSRRGPNQETFGAQDRLGEHIYPWVRVISVDDAPVRAGIYVREDALSGHRPAPPKKGKAKPRERLSDKATDAPRPASVWLQVENVLETAGEVAKLWNQKDRGTDGKVGKIKQGELLKLLEALHAQEAVELDRPGKGAGRVRLLAGFEAAFLELRHGGLDTQGLICLIALHDNALHHPSVESAVKAVLAEKSHFLEWHQDLATLITMLSDRPDLPMGALVKLLKFSLMRFQIQAPISDSMIRESGRQISPLTSEDYARGMQTRLWKAAVDAQLVALITELSGVLAGDGPAGAGKGGKGKQSKSLENQFSEEYFVVAAPQPFEFEGRKPERRQDVPADLLAKPRVCYLSHLRLQLFPKRVADKGRVASHMGARGLRSSLGESADMLAETLARLIKDGNVEKALEIIQGNNRTSELSVAKKKLPKAPFKEIELANRQMVAPREADTETHRWRDPLLTSTTAQLDALHTAYQQLARVLHAHHSDMMRMDFDVLNALVRGNMRRFLGHECPARVTALVTDQLHDLFKLALRWNTLMGGKPELTSSVLEVFYERMQTLHEAVRFRLHWGGGDPQILLHSIAGILANPHVAPTATFAAPHGLSMIAQVGKAAQKQTKKHATWAGGQTVGILRGAYYETPALFAEHADVATVADPSLLNMPVIVMEPHPNNAALQKVIPHDPVALLQALSKSGKKHTVIMDVTLNHLGEHEIARILQAAAPAIKSGHLNLVLVQSGTKFLQHGMDIVSLGIAAVFNNANHWVTFNTEMEQNRQSVPADDALYLGRLLTHASPQLGRYLDAIRNNTALMKNALQAGLAGSHGLEVWTNRDDRTVYVTIAPTPICVEELFSKSAGKKGPDVEAMEAVYKMIQAGLKSLKVDTRSSFGFNLTNIGQIITSIRITPGIEDGPIIQAYVDAIVEVSKRLDAQIKAATHRGDEENPSKDKTTE